MNAQELLEKVIDPLHNTIMRIAHGNADFVCSDCMHTIIELLSILRSLNHEIYDTDYKLICDTLGVTDL